MEQALLPKDYFCRGSPITGGGFSDCYLPCSATWGARGSMPAALVPTISAKCKSQWGKARGELGHAAVITTAHDRKHPQPQLMREGFFFSLGPEFVGLARWHSSKFVSVDPVVTVDGCSYPLNDGTHPPAR